MKGPKISMDEFKSIYSYCARTRTLFVFVRTTLTRTRNVCTELNPEDYRVLTVVDVFLVSLHLERDMAQYKHTFHTIRRKADASTKK